MQTHVNTTIEEQQRLIARRQRHSGCLRHHHIRRCPAEPRIRHSWAWNRRLFDDFDLGEGEGAGASELYSNPAHKATRITDTMIAVGARELDCMLLKSHTSH